MASSELDARSPLLLLKDRTDTFACTLLELVQIDAGVRWARLAIHAYHLTLMLPGSPYDHLRDWLARFRAILTDYVNSVGSEETRALLGACFERLFSARGVVVSGGGGKANERSFIMNMRDCVIELQLFAQHS